MNRLLIILLSACLLVVSSPAWGKGFVKLTIIGPGLDQPIELSGVLEDPESEAGRIARLSGLDELLYGMFGQGGRTLPETLGEAPRGPVYRLCWAINIGVIIPVDLYPYADGGPLLHLEPGQYEPPEGASQYRRMRVKGGWYQADDRLLHALVEQGVPLHSQNLEALAPPSDCDSTLPESNTSGVLVDPAVGITASSIFLVATIGLWVATRKRPSDLSSSS